MQILYIDKLQSMGYEQDNYAIIETIKKNLKSLQHIFINNKQWILIEIHTFTLNLHCTIYDSNKSMIKTLPNNII